MQVASCRKLEIAVFGCNYDTQDGTGICDDTHVVDLCSAHLLSLQDLVNGGDSERFNLGNGNGISVKELIDAVELIAGCKVRVVYGPQRAGDPIGLVADATKARVKLSWEPVFTDLVTIIQHS